jgi:hypothetical protein
MERLQLLMLCATAVTLELALLIVVTIYMWTAVSK